MPETPENQLKVGDYVNKIGGDYRYEGVIVARFSKTSGQVRFVVENSDGLLFIFSGNNLGHWERLS